MGFFYIFASYVYRNKQKQTPLLFCRVVKLKHAETGEMSVLHDAMAAGASSVDAWRSTPTFKLRNETVRKRGSCFSFSFCV
jgi:hypothetical protein